MQLPLDCFQGQEIGGVIGERFAQLSEGEAFAVNFQSHVNWEDPDTSMTPGENQVAASELTGQTGVFAYTCYSDALTPGERAHMIIDFKVRLDALGAPYAFGTMYGDENLLAFRMDPQYLNPFVLNSIGGYGLDIAAGDGGPGVYLTHSTAWEIISMIEEDGQAVGVAYSPGPEYGETDLVIAAQRAARSSDPTLYLERDGLAIASVPAQQVLEMGRAEFRDFRMEGGKLQTDAMARYIGALIGETTMPSSCVQVGSELLDAQGNSLFREVSRDDLGGQIEEKPQRAALIEEVKRYCSDTGRKAYRNEDGTIYVHLDIPVDPELPGELAGAMEEALGSYAFGDRVYDDILVFAPVDEQGEERLRLFLSGRWDDDRQEYVQTVQLVLADAGRLSLLAEPILAWWDAWDPAQYGFEKSIW